MAPESTPLTDLLELERQAVRLVETARSDAAAARAEAQTVRAADAQTARLRTEEDVRAADADARHRLDDELARLRAQHAAELALLQTHFAERKAAGAAWLLARLRQVP